MGLFKRKAKEDHRMVYVGEAIDEILDKTGSIKGEGIFWTEVVGESFYQDNLEQVCGGRNAGGTVVDECLAMIAFEPDNKHDKNAIVVKIADFPVGYIAKDDQYWVAPLIRKVKRSGGNGSYVRARLTGGWDNGQGSRGRIGVELDLNAPD